MAMNCADIAELAPLYIGGDLDAGRASEFDAHLKTCSACVRELEIQSRLDARLREALLAEEIDVAAVDRRIREMVAQGSLADAMKRVRPVRRAWVSAAIGIAAAFLLAVAAYLLVPGRASQVYADAAGDHQDEVVQHSPRRWFTDPSQIDALAQRLGMDVVVPDELASGFHLEHAKICRLNGHLYLHAVYTDGTREFSLFLRPRDDEKFDARVRGFANGRLLRECASGNERLASFTTPHLNAVVATGGSASDSLAYAKLASAAIAD
jgi:anti-sigma factor RsiW